MALGPPNRVKIDIREFNFGDGTAPCAGSARASGSSGGASQQAEHPQHPEQQ